MAWESGFPGHLRAINARFLDTYRLRSQNALIDARVDRIEPIDNAFDVWFTDGAGVRRRLVYDRVIACTGFRFDSTMFDHTCMPDDCIDGRFPQQTIEWESSNVAGLYFAGTLMQARDYRKSASAFIHGFRYNVRAFHRLLELKHHVTPWPSRSVAASPESLTAVVAARLSTTSGLWHQFGQLCDLVVVDAAEGRARYFEEMPAGYVGESVLARNECCYTMTLEYWPRGGRNEFLHPVIRQFTRGKLVAEQHLAEDASGEWRSNEDLDLLAAFFRRPLPGLDGRTGSLVRAGRSSVYSPLGEPGLAS
jgi:hypothetical protein